MADEDSVTPRELSREVKNCPYAPMRPRFGDKSTRNSSIEDFLAVEKGVHANAYLVHVIKAAAQLLRST